MIFGFIIDPAFTDQSLEVVRPEEISVLHGRLTTEQMSYFVNPLYIKDRRTNRMPVYGVSIISNLQILLDSDKEDDGDITAFLNAGNDGINSVFNTTEKVLYRNIQQTVSEINDELIADTDTFAGYVPGSLYISTDVRDTYIYDIINAEEPIMDWVRFKINLNGTIIEFKFWIYQTAFVDQYPHSTISEIIPPAGLTDLVDPTSMEDIYMALQEGATTAAETLANKMNLENYTGIYNHETRYIDPSTELMHMISFNILYKGKEPGVLDIRIKIKDYLLNSGIGDEAIWKARFPDLFIIGQFFLIPMWDQYVVRPTGNTYPSVELGSTIKSVRDKLLFDLPEDTRDLYELMTCAYREFVILSVPDDLNQTSDTFKDIHPTYQRYSPQSSEFQYMEEHTRVFASNLNNALSIAAPDPDASEISHIFTWSNFDDRVFISFVVEDIEYHVITKASYIENMEV